MKLKGLRRVGEMSANKMGGQKARKEKEI